MSGHAQQANRRPRPSFDLKPARIRCRSRPEADLPGVCLQAGGLRRGPGQFGIATGAGRHARRCLPSAPPSSAVPAPAAGPCRARAAAAQRDHLRGGAQRHRGRLVLAVPGCVTATTSHASTVVDRARGCARADLVCGLCARVRVGVRHPAAGFRRAGGMGRAGVRGGRAGRRRRWDRARRLDASPAGISVRRMASALPSDLAEAPSTSPR